MYMYQKNYKNGKFSLNIADSFFENWLKNHPKFLLHFLIHINVLMLCRKFELIPTNNFQVMSILKTSKTSKKL